MQGSEKFKFGGRFHDLVEIATGDPTHRMNATTTNFTASKGSG